MFKKVLVPLILALVVALPFSGVAYAANGVNRYVGTIISVDSALNTFKLDTTSGMKLTIHVDSATIYAGQVSSLASLKPSMSANVQYKWVSSEYMATHILVRPGRQVTQYVNGKVASIGATSFTLMGNNGRSYTFNITSKSLFSGLGVSHFRELKTGMVVRVSYRNLNGADNVLKVLVRKQ